MNYGSILTELGYVLTDHGNFWQTNALFRGGDNQTAISIFKDSGVWTDFVEGSQHYPFEALVEKTTGKKFNSECLELAPTFYQQKLLSDEKIYPKEALKKLLPDYSYFESRGISAKTQSEYKCGLATGGKLYQRIVFPIFRYDGKIHGFDGRKVLQDNDNIPKWKHVGKAADWLYPYYSVDGVQEQIEDDNMIFLVESIGDSMALYQAGIKNNCVTFTNKIGPKLISKLTNIGCDVILAFNNDSDKKQNRGFDGALSSFLKLMDVIDFDKIWFYPPPKGDFGDMEREEIAEWRSDLDLTQKGHSVCVKRLIDYAPKAKIAKALIPKIKKMKREWEDRYE